MFLDTILDDLQHSISRPGSSLGQPITNYSSHRDVHYIQPANSTTIMRERSLSPTSNVSTYQKLSSACLFLNRKLLILMQTILLMILYMFFLDKSCV